MGGDDSEERRSAFEPYQVDEALMERAPDARFLHCLPARRGEEVTAPVIDGSRSAVWRQAENRMHTARGAMLWMLEGIMKARKPKVVLAYSGGLDTSIILKWLQTEYDAEVVTFTADLGQGEEVEPARRKAEMLGVKPENIFIEDLREEFVRDFVFPMFRANTQYEGDYLLGTSIARPLIAKRQIEIARQVGADAVCHGATGKGNDQVRFELGYYALEPDIRVIAPWREWEFQSREQLIDFAEKHQIPIAKDKRGKRHSRSTPTCCTPHRKGRCSKIRPRKRPNMSTSAPFRPRTRRTRRRRYDRFETRRCGRDRRRNAVTGSAADEAQPARPRQRHRPPRPG